MDRATDIRYLLRTYREGYGETEPNVDNIEALIESFFHETEYSWFFLYSLRDLNPELSEYEKPLFFIDRFICYTFVVRESFTGGPNVRSVMEHLLNQAEYSGNYSTPVTAFKELSQISFNKIDEFGHEVMESFAPFNATRLDNTVDVVKELQSILSQWIDKYS